MKIYRSTELGAAELKEKLKDKLGDEFDIQFNPLSVDELLHSDFDLIELPEAENQNLLSKMTVLDWLIKSTRAADAFEKVGQIFKPIHLSSTAFVTFLESKHLALDTSKSAVLVGEYSFLMTYSIALSKLGYKKIYLISPTNISFDQEIETAQKYLFDVDLIQISFDKMDEIGDFASVCAIDFNLNDYPELVETLTYFNFVGEKALFFDLRNYLNDVLSSEADKASLLVLDSVEFHSYRYRLFQKNRK